MERGLEEELLSQLEVLKTFFSVGQAAGDYWMLSQEAGKYDGLVINDVIKVLL